MARFGMLAKSICAVLLVNLALGAPFAPDAHAQDLAARAPESRSRWGSKTPSTEVWCETDEGEGIGNGCFNGGNNVLNGGTTSASNSAGGEWGQNQRIECESGTDIGIGNGCFNGGNNVGNIGSTSASNSARSVPEAAILEDPDNEIGAFNGQGNGHNRVEVLSGDSVAVSA